jgi:transposase
MALGKRRRQAKQVSMWVATQDLPRSAAHPFYTRLNQILDQHDFDRFVEGLCERFYADESRPGLPPGRYFRLLLIGYFEGLDAERAIAWRATDSFALREFLGLVLPEAPPDHSTKPGFNVQSLSDTEHGGRRQFTKPHVCYLGAHTGCSCGFAYGQISPTTEKDGRGRCRPRLRPQIWWTILQKSVVAMSIRH